jgi:hypothetical protein
VALAVQDLCREKGRIDMPVGAGTTDLTGKGCSPYGVHWTYDTYSGAKGPVQSLVGQGLKKWYFITTDYAFGHSLEANASAILKASGGEIAGAVRTPLGEPDYSSHLLRASTSGAQALGICAGGNDLVNIVKQMAEFGLIQGGMQAAALNCSMMNIRSIGLENAQGLIYTEAYYCRRPLSQDPRPPALRLPGQLLGRGYALPQGCAGRWHGCGRAGDYQDARDAHQRLHDEERLHPKGRPDHPRHVPDASEKALRQQERVGPAAGRAAHKGRGRFSASERGRLPAGPVNFLSRSLSAAHR